MSVIENTTRNLGRARYTAAQGVRSAWYGAQYAIARRRSAGVTRPGEPPFRPRYGRPSLAALRSAWLDLFRQDRANIEAGLYPRPSDVRMRDLPGSVARARHFLADLEAVERRRLARNGTEVRENSGANPDRFPPYYRQNFHYQTDGWLSDESAALYDHQVEALFTGAGDAMRRAALGEVSREIRGRDQRDVQFLDLACGTGRFLANTLEAFPRLRVTGLDLSPNYVARARQTVAAWPSADIVEGAGEALPFEDDRFDVLTTIFLFHELPLKIRRQVISEIARVLRPGGLLVVADSLQFGDNPELDGVLEYFPEAFHEPYYRGYLDWDMRRDMAEHGLATQSRKRAFLTSVSTWRN